ncbi:MAG: hypothetical protein ABIQ60_10135 [Burkholderiaceae bacterium]
MGGRCDGASRAGIERFLGNPARLTDAYLGGEVVGTGFGVTDEPAGV